ncbi:hypothetical protein [Streptomyces sp. NPDC101393]|uniref:hypothetical protein n=1 Tax=Streptomyces sp. NPDC101393 TaxID=3366141 RepID=UPI0037FE5446
MSKAEGAKALQHFTEQYNKANTSYNPKLNLSYESGALLAIDQAGLKWSHAVSPKGNPTFRPLTLKDAQFTVPKQKGWPKSFVADAMSNRRNATTGQPQRWFLVFSRDSIDAQWRAEYFATFAGNATPKLKKDEDGYAEAVPTGSGSGLTVNPGKLSRTYADYLNTGKGEAFAPGPHTDGWRERRAKNANQVNARLLWQDRPSDYQPVALRTADGGALVFFSTVYHQQKTAAEGLRLNLVPGMRGILDGPAKKTNRMAFTTVSAQAVKVPAKDSDGKITILNRIERMTAARTL